MALPVTSDRSFVFLKDLFHVGFIFFSEVEELLAIFLADSFGPKRDAGIGVFLVSKSRAVLLRNDDVRFNHGTPGRVRRPTLPADYQAGP